VGDSRVYRLRHGVIEQLTFDHSLQWEMIRQGRATAENSELLHPKNVITRCLGANKHLEIDVEGPFDVRAGDQFLLCSDGLTGHVTDSEMGAVVNLLPAAEASRMLIDLANSRGGTDNTTVVIAVVEEYPAVKNPTIESQAGQTESRGPADQVTAARRAVWGRVSIVLFGLFALSGLILLMTSWKNTGLSLVSGALLLGFVQLIMSTRRHTTVEVGESGHAASQALMGVREPAECSPYRRESAELGLEFLDLLSQGQGELTSAAIDNGWRLDVEELTRLSRQAAVAREDKLPGSGLYEYAKALRILMKEFTGHMRPRG